MVQITVSFLRQLLQGLPALDVDGMADPYVSITFGVQKRTATINKTLNPSFNEIVGPFEIDAKSDASLLSVLNRGVYFSVCIL